MPSTVCAHGKQMGRYGHTHTGHLHHQANTRLPCHLRYYRYSNTYLECLSQRVAGLDVHRE